VARPSMPAEALPTADPMPVVRYLDVLLVLLAAPFVVLMGAPLLGYAAGAAAWVLHRVLGALVEHRARAQADARSALGLSLGGVIARTWLVGLTILVVGLAGAREDGLTAAIVLLAAFTVYFVASLLLRSLERKTPRQ